MRIRSFRRRGGLGFVVALAAAAALVTGSNTLGDPGIQDATPSPRSSLGDLRESPTPPPGGDLLAPEQSAPLDKTTPRFVPDELRMRFRAGTTAAERASVRRRHGVTLERKTLDPQVQLVKLEKGTSEPQAAATLERDPRVEWAELNLLYQVQAIPNDPKFGNLWGLNNTGQTVNNRAGTPDADIDAPEAWDLQRTSSSVTVAVVDTGVDWGHPDLDANIWTNPGETGGGKKNNGEDDHLNGLPDDWHGWDFVDNDKNPRDPNGHGTHVSGTIGAEGNNGAGVTGVNWDVKIMPLRVCPASGIGCPQSAINDAFRYAAQNGADVVNVSLACEGCTADQEEFNRIAGAPDTLFVVSAGNGGFDRIGDDTGVVPAYPCNHTAANLICVAASDQDDNRASFSNYGRTSVDLAAPGTNTLSTLPHLDGPNHGFESGTSMASPHVAGAAALYLAEAPGASVSRLRQGLLGTVDRLPAFASITATGGRLNLHRLIAAATGRTVTEVTPSGGELEIKAARGQENNIFVTESGGVYTIDDYGSGQGISPASGCTAVTDDRVTCGPAAINHITVDAGDENDIVNLANTTVSASVGGGPGDDTLYGGSGVDSLSGGDNDDTLDGGPGGDMFNGGEGTDTVTYASRDEAVTADLDAEDGDDGANCPGPSCEGDSIWSAQIEGIVGGSNNDILTGGVKDNTLEGGPGDDILIGGVDALSGNDTLIGGLNDDILDGGPGTSVVPGDDTLDGGEGDDTLTGGPGDDDFYGGPGNDNIFARDGIAENPVDCGESPGDDDYAQLDSDDVDFGCERPDRPDTTPPDTTIDPEPSGTIADSTPTFTFSSNEPGSTFECRVVDMDPDWSQCNSGSYTTPPLSDDSHTFEVRATDLAGNTDQTPASRTFTVDTVPLETTASVQGSMLLVQARRASNDITVTRLSDDIYTVRDTAVAVVPVAPCSPVSANKVSCPAGSIDEIRIEAGESPDVVQVASDDPVTILGEDGNDELTGGSGDDTLIGGPGSDTLDGDLGSDTFIGNGHTLAGDTVTYEGRQADVVADADGQQDDGAGCADPGPACEGDNVGADIENITGGGGNDELTSSDDTNTIHGLRGGPGEDTLNGGAGVDHLYGGDNRDTLNGGDSMDFLYGKKGDDELHGGPGRDTLSGGAEDDTLDGGPGGSASADADTIHGDTGDDTVTYESRTTRVVIDLDTTSPYNGENCVPGTTDQPPDCEGDRFASVENVTGGSGDDWLGGDSNSNTLVGGPGDDDFYGGPGDDRINSLDGLGEDPVDCGDGTQDTAIVDVDDVWDTNCEIVYDSPAGTATVMNGGSWLYYAAAPGVANNVGVSQSGSTYVVADSSGPVDPGAGCTATADATRVECDAAGIDWIVVAAGDRDDTVVIDAPADVIGHVSGGDGGDVLTGGDENDYLFGDEGTDELNGGEGNDFLLGGSEDDTLGGGPGDDTVSYAERSERVVVTIDDDAHDGEDCPGPDCEGDNVRTDVEGVIGGRGPDSLTGSSLRNTLRGGPGNDELRGGAKRDLLFGDEDDDTLDGGGGADKLYGGEDTDTADYSDRTEPVTVYANNLSQSGEDSEGDSVFVDVESLTGGSEGDFLWGTYRGGGTLDGGEGNDFLFGGAGIDELNGGGGDDWLYGSGEVDRLDGGPDSDTLYGGSGGDDLHGGGGNTDTVSYAWRSGRVVVTIDDGADDGQSGGAEGDNVHTDVEWVIGGKGSDSLTGSSLRNTLRGGPGNDELWGGGERDYLYGDAGDDTLDGQEGPDLLFGGEDTDTADYSDRTEPVTVYANNLSQSGEDGEGDTVHVDVESLTGGSGGDILSASPRGGGTLDGGEGADTFIGRAGRDTIEARDGASDTSIACGGEQDEVRADALPLDPDTIINSDCETVTRGGTSGASGSAPASTPAPSPEGSSPASDTAGAPTADSQTLSIRTTRARVTRSGVVRIRLRCSSEVASCEGTLRLKTTRALKPGHGSKKVRRLTLARRRFRVPAGKTRTVKVRLTRSARRVLRHRKRLRARVQARSGTNGQLARTRTVTLK